MSVDQIAVTSTRNAGGSVLETVYAVRSGRIYRMEISDGRHRTWQQLPDIPDGELSWTRSGTGETG